jgi:uncharacterized protein YceK
VPVVVDPPDGVASTRIVSPVQILALQQRFLAISGCFNILSAGSKTESSFCFRSLHSLWSVDSPAWGPERHPRTDLPSLSGSSHLLPFVLPRHLFSFSQSFNVFPYLPGAPAIIHRRCLPPRAGGWPQGIMSCQLKANLSAFGDISFLAEQSSGAEAPNIFQHLPTTSHIFQHLICNKQTRINN